MIYLHKFIPLIASPLFLVFILILWSIFFSSKRASLSALVILLICSLPIFSNKLLTNLEKNYLLAPISSAKTSDAIVVLSGMVTTVNSVNGVAYEWGDAVDRIFAGIELVKGKKAPVLILTAGKLPWSVGKPEGNHLKEISMKYGISDDIVHITEKVQNTDQEARAVAKLLNKEKPSIILVTSAFHMPRAKRVFEEADISVYPFPVDFRGNTNKTTFLDFIPSAVAFQNTSFFIRETIGRIYYDLKY